jgi:hypothetical protein
VVVNPFDGSGACNERRLPVSSHKKPSRKRNSTKKKTHYYAPGVEVRVTSIRLMKTFLIHADGQLFKFHNTHFYRYKIRLPFVAFTVKPIRDYGYVTNDALTHTHTYLPVFAETLMEMRRARNNVTDVNYRRFGFFRSAITTSGIIRFGKYHLSIKHIV